jgi:hypothetical protein
MLSAGRSNQQCRLGPFPPIQQKLEDWLTVDAQLLLGLAHARAFAASENGEDGCHDLILVASRAIVNVADTG